MFTYLHTIRFATLLRPRRWRNVAYGVLWLLLLINAQLALASHNCNLQPSALPTSRQHGANMLHGAGNPAAAPQQVCEKHCVPDSVQPDTHTLPLIVLPNNTRLSITPRHDEPQLQNVAWLMPPIAGPPAEERFCRYRE